VSQRPAIRALVFDLFDTLVDLHMETTPRAEFAGRQVPRSLVDIHALCCAHRAIRPDDFLGAMREVDVELRASRFAQDLEVPSEMRFGRLLERLEIDTPDLTASIVALHMGVLRGQVRPVEHHAELLAELGSQVRIGLCSNFSHSPTAERILLESGLDTHLDTVVISDRVGVRKPRAEIFRAVLEALDVSPDETLHVGDNLHADVRGAAALGIRTAWITRRVADPAAVLAEFDGPAPDWQIQDLAELRAILAGHAGPV